MRIDSKFAIMKLPSREVLAVAGGTSAEVFKLLSKQQRADMCANPDAIVLLVCIETDSHEHQHDINCDYCDFDAWIADSGNNFIYCRESDIEFFTDLYNISAQ